MDWTELRHASRHNADRVTLTDERIAAMRRGLDRRVAEELSRRASAPRRARLLPAAGALGLVATAVVFVTVGLALGPAPKASAEVSRTLRAAATTIAATDSLDTGVRIDYQRWVTDGNNSLLIGGSYAQRQIEGTDVWERRYLQERVLDSWGRSKGALTAETEAEVRSGGATRRRSDQDEYFWSSGGPAFSPASVRALPRAPVPLLERLQGGSKNPERAIDNAAALLESGLADNELQAAVYRALVRIPGLTLDRDVRDIDGRAGAGIGLDVSGGLQRVVLIIDPDTGRYLGQTEINLGVSASAPGGTIVRASAVHDL